MKKTSFTFSILVSLTLLAVLGCKKSTPEATKITETPKVTYSSKEIYHYTFKSIDGDLINISDFKGKKIMFVNTASFCGNTPQYAKLEDLYKKYSSKLVILGFPCNQFGGQEPNAEGQIEEFCTNTYGITFPMASKIDVKGPACDSIYIWLKDKNMNGVRTTTVDWNFQKYLVDENGKYLEMFANDMQPDDPKIISAINK